MERKIHLHVESFGTEVIFLRRKKSRHIQLQLDLDLGLMAVVTRKEEGPDAFDTLPKALFLEHKISKPDPFFLEITAQHII